MITRDFKDMINRNLSSKIFIKSYLFYITILAILFSILTAIFILLIQKKSIFTLDTLIYALIFFFVYIGIYLSFSYFTYKKVQKNPFVFFDMLKEYPEKEYDKLNISRYTDLIEQLSHKYNLGLPMLYILDYGSINGFVSREIGSSDFAIAITKTTLEKLDANELENFLEILYLKILSNESETNLLATILLYSYDKFYLLASTLYSGSKAIKRNYFRSSTYNKSQGARFGLDHKQTRKNKSSNFVAVGFIFLVVYALNFLWKYHLRNQLREKNNNFTESLISEDNKEIWCTILKKVRDNDLGSYIDDSKSVELLALFDCDIHKFNTKKIHMMNQRIKNLQKSD